MTIIMNEVIFDGPTAIDGYGPGGFRVGGDWVDGPVFLSPSRLTPWPVSNDPQVPDFARLTEAFDGADVVLVGFGAEPRMVSPEVQAFFDGLGIGVEPMATPAACRTYNVLINEGRRVGAALLPIS